MAEWIALTAFGSLIGAFYAYKYRHKIKMALAPAARLIGLDFHIMAGTVVFAVRGTLTARYSSGGATGLAFGNTPPVSAADAGALSGNSLQWPANNNQKSVNFPGRSNTPNGRSISILIRYRPAYTGTPGNTKSIMFMGSGAGRQLGLEIQHANTTGNVQCLCRNELGTIVMNSASFGAWSPTSGTWYDIVFTWDGTGAANAATVYIDAVQLGQTTPSGALSASWTNQYFSEISFGSGQLAGTMNAERVDEVVIWDDVIDPTAVALESGTGALDGAARTSLVAATAFDGSTYTDPGVGNVKSGTSYTFAGVSQTGTLVTTTSTGGVIVCGPGPMGRN